MALFLCPVHSTSSGRIACYRGDGVRYETILPNESPAQLSARLNRPVCMLLRANRLYSVAWLLPDREILLPERDFCRRDAGICPCCLLEKPLKAIPSAGKATLRPKETMAGFAVRHSCAVRDVCELNRLQGRPVPGMRLCLPDSPAK